MAPTRIGAPVSADTAMTAEASSLNHPARQFLQDRYASSVAELSQHFGEAVDAEEIGPLSAAQIEQEHA
jgi:hypothetical protein